eukprot:m.140219 g.140219  ORF g.140219 m.140219 type:complete len:128 (-) comp9625_c0_seq18:1521-1904(-)
MRSPSTVEASDLDELDSVFEPPHTPPPRRMQDAAVPNDEQPTLRSTGDAGPAAPGNGLVTSPNALLSSPMRPSSPTLAALTAKRAALKGAIETVSSQVPPPHILLSQHTTAAIHTSLFGCCRSATRC